MGGGGNVFQNTLDPLYRMLYIIICEIVCILEYFLQFGINDAMGPPEKVLPGAQQFFSAALVIGYKSNHRTSLNNPHLQYFIIMMVLLWG